ncbi:MAG: CDP-glycerol glycerophosphotransferase family protein [Psychrobacter sp.]|uniref:CDP-glycerol glycerophosphotransferase family protein n=1 Tax=Psychrobacter TaxID=497 RepID=UPI002647714B|nr:CDP-glycerol glycerophosphotransferase family protein [Psychrobacter sp.]MDN5619371.1 CDP-glycerol glycerophosphotransferase family protein [Psychrobacter sp.]
MNKYKIAFIGWNPFQFIHIKLLASKIPGSVFILEKRRDHLNDFTKEILTNQEVPVVVWETGKIKELDGVFDVIVCQTMFLHLPLFEKTKIVMLQYGYAKEPHNYGTWRALADLCLVYGSYPEKKLSTYAPSEAVGNPRLQLWYDEDFHLIAKNKYIHSIDDGLLTVLYMPTWGELSSIDEYIGAVLGLSERYNVLVKLHHNTDLLEDGRLEKIETDRIHFFGSNDDALELLSISDIVISDYSGAIFDAIHCEKPVVLLDKNENEILEEAKIDTHSLEFNRRDELGYRVARPSDLIDGIKHIEENYDYIVGEKKAIKSELYEYSENSVEKCIEAINSLISGDIVRNQMQSYIHDSVKELYQLKRQYNILKKSKNGR